MSQTKMPQTGQMAPEFTLPATTGDSISLSQLRGRATVVLYFYPKADTPGCTTEACGFRDALADYTEAEILVFGISPDPIAEVRKFADKFHLNFPLLADADHSVCEQYGVWGKKQMAGKEYMGVGRTTFVIDRNGLVAKVFEKVKPDGHDREVLEWIEGQ